MTFTFKSRILESKLTIFYEINFNNRFRKNIPGRKTQRSFSIFRNLAWKSCELNYYMICILMLHIKNIPNFTWKSRYSSKTRILYKKKIFYLVRYEYIFSQFMTNRLKPQNYYILLLLYYPPPPPSSTKI